MEENIKISSEFEDEYLENEDSSQKDKYITFILGKEEYAIGIEFVKEIIGIQNITRLPDVDEYVMGVINLRGKIIPIVDMRLRFSLEQIPFGDRTCIIVLNIGEFTTGLVVDEVSEVLDILPSNIDPPPAINKGLNSEFISGIGKIKDQVIIILDASRIFNYEIVHNLAEVDA
jgi:purine-binding chemotaxis protein CheW